MTTEDLELANVTRSLVSTTFFYLIHSKFFRVYNELLNERAAFIQQTSLKFLLL